MRNKLMTTTLVTPVLLALLLVTAGQAYGQQLDMISDVTLAADRSEYVGPCPREIHLKGKLKVNEGGLGVASVQFVHSDGRADEPRPLTVNDKREYVVEATLTERSSWNDQVYMKVIVQLPSGPKRFDSNRITIKGECQFYQAVTRSESISLGPASGRFRVTLNGFTCNSQTLDDPLQADGVGDEVFLFSKSFFVEMRADGSGVNASPPMQGLTPVFGQININDLPFFRRIQGGSGRNGLGTPINCCGGFRAGDSYPGDPSQHSINPRPDALPQLIWEGELRRRQSAVVIMPMIFERDDDDNRFILWRNATLYSFSEVGKLIADPNLTDQELAKWDLRREVTNQLRYRKPFGDRPIGLRPARYNRDLSGIYFVNPELLILTYDEALRMALESQRNNGKAFKVIYADDPEDPALGGNYTLYIQVEQMP